MRQFFVIKNGMIVKKFNNEDIARAFASKCNTNNQTSSFIVCEKVSGILQEI